MTDHHTTEAAVIRDLALKAAADVKVIPIVEGRQLGVVIPDGYRVEDVMLDVFAEHPSRQHGTAHFDEPESFLYYLIERVDASAAGYYGDADRLRLTAVLNDDAGNSAGWRDFRAVLHFRPTPEWEAWTAFDKKLVRATEFADFIEEWQHTVLDPDAATMRDIVRNFRATKTVQFGDEIQDKSGDRSLQYTVQTTAGAGRTGELAIPDTLTLHLAPFVGAELTELVANFRYRVDNGAAAFGVALVQPGKLVRDAFENEVREIGEQVGARVMLGTPAEG